MEMVLVRDTAPKYYDALKKSGQNYDLLSFPSYLFNM